MKKYFIQNWSTPAALLLLSITSYGLLSPWLGFYWDDWPSIWYLHTLGPAGYQEVFAVDRPLLGVLFRLTTPLLGESTLSWQLFGILTRWLSSLALFWTLRKLWPGRARQAAWAAVLFTLYPGFDQQYISVTYSHVFLVLTSFLLSLGVMLAALRAPQRRLPLLGMSVGLSALTMFTVEYFFGLELLRPVFIWLVLSEKTAGFFKRLKTTLLCWLPYLVGMGVFLAWRILLTDTPRGQVQVFDAVQSSIWRAAKNLLQVSLEDAFQTGVAAWGKLFAFHRILQAGPAFTAVYAAVVLLSAGAAVFILVRFKGLPAAVDESPGHPGPGHSGPGHPGWRWALQAIGIGLFALLVGGIPFWMTRLPIDLRFPWDRFTLAMMLGSSLVFVGLLELLGRKPVPKAIVFGVVIGLAVGWHLYTANMFRREWNTQKDFFWQLTWRAPALQPGTAVLTTELPFVYFSDNSLTAPLNWTYSRENRPRKMDYVLYSLESRLGVGIADLDAGQEINQFYRATTFLGSTDQALFVSYAPPGCLRVFDPVMDRRLPQKPRFFSEALHLSRLDLIETAADSPARPPAAIFGAEPEPNWCYYYEKAELARQGGDWRQVAALADQAQALRTRLYPVNAPELVPLIEGYARTGQWEKAEALTWEAYELTFRMKGMLCEAWSRIAAETAPSAEQRVKITGIQDQLKCTEP